jgi:raffinose/stachyose/melibiose transport system permease protein
MKNINKTKGGYFNLFILGVFFILFMFPLLLILMNSFKNKFEIISDTLALPTSFSLSNYIEAFNRMNYLVSFLNTLVISVASVIFICIFSSMTAHLFVRNRWKFNTFMFFLMVASMIIPFQTLMIPLVKMFGSMGLLNSKWILVYLYMAAGTPLAVFIYHGFIKSIPLELEEAALIDGCTELQTFFKIVFPLLKSTTVSIIILDVLWLWNDFLLPYLVLKEPSQKTLTLATMSFVQSHSADYGLMMAGLIMAVIPILLIYIFLQKYVIKGVMQGAIK